jgi:hypothetical protein
MIGAGLLAPVIGLSVTSYLTGALLIALAITTFFVVRKSGGVPQHGANAAKGFVGSCLASEGDFLKFHSVRSSGGRRQGDVCYWHSADS